MVARIHTIAFSGIDTIPVEVQVSITSSTLHSFTIVGLPDKAIAESKERIRAALTAIGLALPMERITINLSPADILKEGSHYDLPIALGLIAAMHIIPSEELQRYIAIGELSLDGSTCKVNGVLPAAIHASANAKGIICPKANGKEACWAGEELEILATDSLLSLINHFKGIQLLSRPRHSVANQNKESYPDLRDIRGQESAKRALEIAAAGGHNMLMIGPPGSGKSMLASRLPGLVPPLESTQMLENSIIASVSGQLENGNITTIRPFRDPHHSCSMAAMVGGGRAAKPGEITLAHNGVLFLDELPEFPRNVLDSLRQPLETGRVTVARAQAHITYPSNFQLIAAMNPCRCGYLGDANQACNKAPRCGSDYQSRISGPLFDRIDIHIDVPAVSPTDLHKPMAKEGSKEVAERVATARAIQAKRYQQQPYHVNAEADGEILIAVSNPDAEGKALLDKALETLNLSMRGYMRVLRVARTIADLDGKETVNKHHIAEALGYRKMQLRG